MIEKNRKRQCQFEAEASASSRRGSDSEKLVCFVGCLLVLLSELLSSTVGMVLMDIDWDVQIRKVMAMDSVYTAQRILCVPLYYTLGAGAVEFIIGHTEASIAFVEETRIPELLKALSNTKEYLKTIESFTKITAAQEEKSEIKG
ncbi:Long chain acyl-CoA synthetase 5-like protein [Drosera capensis]